MKTSRQISRITEHNVRTIYDELPAEAQYRLWLNGSPEYVFRCSPANADVLVTGYLLCEKKIHAKEAIRNYRKTGTELHVEISNMRKAGTDSGNSFPGISASSLIQKMDAFNKSGAVFNSTGGTHLSGLLKDNSTAYIFEDISRHNAFLKCAGNAVTESITLSSCAVLLSCRISSSILRLIINSGIKTVFSLATVTDQAATMADEAGISLYGFIRDQRINHYAGPQIIS